MQRLDLAQLAKPLPRTPAQKSAGSTRISRLFAARASARNDENKSSSAPGSRSRSRRMGKPDERTLSVFLQTAKVFILNKGSAPKLR
jgi:hypothetical protein